MTRVLVVHPGAELYGTDRMVVESTRALLGAGCDVVVVLGAEGPLVDVLRAAGATVSVLPVPVLRKAWLSPGGLVRLAGLAVRSVPDQWRLLRRTSPDVVYVSTLTLPTWTLLARLARRRVVVHVHEAEEDARHLLQVLLLLPLRAAHLVLANSQATARWVALKQTRVLHNGFPLPDPAPRPRPVGRPVVLALVGRLNPRKGQREAVAATALLRASGRDVHLRLAGDVFPGYEWYRAELEALVRESGLVGQVSFLGFVPEPAQVYREADIVLVPSSTESFGNVAVEALAVGRPVVASAAQGLVEVLEEGGGVLVPAGEAQALAEAVAGLLDLDDEAWWALSAAGQEQVRRRFSAERYGDGLVAEVLGGPA